MQNENIRYQGNQSPLRKESFRVAEKAEEVIQEDQEAGWVLRDTATELLRRAYGLSKGGAGGGEQR